MQLKSRYILNAKRIEHMQHRFIALMTVHQILEKNNRLLGKDLGGSLTCLLHIQQSERAMEHLRDKFQNLFKKDKHIQTGI